MTVGTPPAGNPSLVGDGHPDHGAPSPGVFGGPARTAFGAQTPVEFGVQASAEFGAKAPAEFGGHAPSEPLYPVDLAVLALRGMAAELRARGVEAREDGVSGVVDAGPAARPQSALLRPHRGDLWWWMRWPRQEGVPSALSGVPLSPVARTSDAARRIVGALSASAEGG